MDLSLLARTLTYERKKLIIATFVLENLTSLDGVERATTKLSFNEQPCLDPTHDAIP